MNRREKLSLNFVTGPDVLEQASKSALAVVLGKPVLPLNELKIHFQGLLIEVPPVSEYVLFKRSPCTFNVLGVRSSPGMYKVAMVIHLVVNVAMLLQPVVCTP